MAIILLENIRSALNVGGVFRIADAIGAEKVLLIGYTPAPIDRMGRENGKIAKTALGAEQSVLWQQYTTVADALAAHPNHTPIVVEQTSVAIPYTDYSPPLDSLYIFGNETAGVSFATYDTITPHIHLPMYGTKKSLNITTVVAVTLYHYLACREM